jgi:hypothetical protein
MTIKKMVMKGDIKNLQPKLYGYEDDKTKLNISRVFYEQK